MPLTIAARLADIAGGTTTLVAAHRAEARRAVLARAAQAGVCARVERGDERRRGNAAVEALFVDHRHFVDAAWCVVSSVKRVVSAVAKDFFNSSVLPAM